MFGMKKIIDLVGAVINVEAYPFLAFSELTCHLEDTGMSAFWWCLLIVRRPNLEAVTKKLLRHQPKMLG